MVALLVGAFFFAVVASIGWANSTTVSDIEVWGDLLTAALVLGGYPAGMIISRAALGRLAHVIRTATATGAPEVRVTGKDTPEKG
jgi:hypothetical protein